MLRTGKGRLAAVVATAALSLGITAPAMAQNQGGNSLVNVQVGDVTVQVPIAIAANLCDVNVNVLAQQNKRGSTSCTAVAEPDATGFPGQGGTDNQAGDSLVNVQIGDVTIQVPIGIAANLCDINANVLAQQNKSGRTECTATAVPEAS